MVEVALTGFLTVTPAGGRVGGLLRVLPARDVALGVVLAAVVEVAPGRRTAVVVVPGRFAAVELPVLVEEAGDFAADLGDAAAVLLVPVISSPERRDSSCWTTSNPSTSDMVGMVVVGGVAD